MDQKYLNVLSFKNGKTLAFSTTIPFSFEKTYEHEWIVVTDEVNGQILSFRTSEIVTIAVCKYDPKATGKKKKGFTSQIVAE